MSIVYERKCPLYNWLNQVTDFMSFARNTLPKHNKHCVLAYPMPYSPSVCASCYKSKKCVFCHIHFFVFNILRIMLEMIQILAFVVCG